MRTTLDIPRELLEDARRTFGFRSETDTVIHALRALLRRRRIEELKQMLGHVRLDVDAARSRRRPRSRRRRR